MTVSWYVAQTHHASEQVASHELTRQGFATLSLLCRSQRIVRHRRVERIAPYLPGYIFVEFDIANDPWRSICSTRGVKGLLSTAPEAPTRIRQGVVEELRSRCDEFGIVVEKECDRALRRFLVGDDVRILGGPFAGRVGEVVWSSVDRVRVLMRIFGRETKTLLPCSEVGLVV